MGEEKALSASTGFRNIEGKIISTSSAPCLESCRPFASTCASPRILEIEAMRPNKLRRRSPQTLQWRARVRATSGSWRGRRPRRHRRCQRGLGARVEEDRAIQFGAGQDHFDHRAQSHSNDAGAAGGAIPCGQKTETIEKMVGYRPGSRWWRPFQWHQGRRSGRAGGPLGLGAPGGLLRSLYCAPHKSHGCALSTPRITKESKCSQKTFGRRKRSTAMHLFKMRSFYASLLIVLLRSSSLCTRPDVC